MLYEANRIKTKLYEVKERKECDRKQIQAKRKEMAEAKM
jgi:hypothetical protein